MKEWNVLIVDDHPYFRQAIKNLLAHEPQFKLVGEAANGREALALTKEHRIDIAIIDIEMPELNGPTLIRLMKDAHYQGKIIILSQACEQERLKELIEVGVDAHVLKIEESEEILRALKAVTNHQKYFSPRLGPHLYDLLCANQLLQSQASSSQSTKKEPVVSEREMQVARLVAQGHSNKQVAYLLGCSENTIKSHKTNIMRKIGAKNSVEIGTWIYRNHDTEA